MKRVRAVNGESAEQCFFSNQFLVLQMVVDVSQSKYFRGLWIENAIKLSQILEKRGICNYLVSLMN
jgi:hypothetical protein